jgi:hypothetical protein
LLKAHPVAILIEKAYNVHSSTFSPLSGASADFARSVFKYHGLKARGALCLTLKEKELLQIEFYKRKLLLLPDCLSNWCRFPTIGTV